MLLTKLLKYLLITLVLLFILFQLKFMPIYEHTLTYRNASIAIRRDQHNIPSIRAANKNGAWYALGYTTAEDRLFQIHMKRTVAKGMLAELVGEKAVNMDIFFRELGVAHMTRLATMKMQKEEPDSYEQFQAYCDGINDYVSKRGVGLEFYILWASFEKWTVEDVMAVSKLIDWVQSSDAGVTLVRELLLGHFSKEEVDKMIGSREEHFLLVKEAEIISEQELKESGQYVGQAEEKEAEGEPMVPQSESVKEDDQEFPEIMPEEEVMIEDGEMHQKHHKKEQKKHHSNDNKKQPKHHHPHKEEHAMEEQHGKEQQNEVESLQEQHQQEPILGSISHQMAPEKAEEAKEQFHEQEENRLEHSQERVQAQQQEQEQHPHSQQHQHHHHHHHHHSRKSQHDTPLEVEHKSSNEEATPDQTKEQRTDDQMTEEKVIPHNHETQGDPVSVEEIPQEYLHIVDSGAGASNSWIISGEHTASGRPILANDPHLSTAIPSDWYQAGIIYNTSQGQRSMKGSFLAGVGPTAFLGRTGHLAWGCTTEYKDTQDLYRQKIENNKYLVDGQWRDLIVRNQTIRVRNGNDRVITVRSTHRGPLMTRLICLERLVQMPGNISLAWTGIHSEYKFSSYMLQIPDIADSGEIHLSFPHLEFGYSMNLVYITKDDQMGYQTIGRVPLRKGVSPSYILDGTTSEHDWIGFINGTDKLRLRNPKKGYVVTANSRPAGPHFKGQYYNNNFQVTARAVRISKLLREKIESGKKLTVQDSIDIQLDPVDEYCLLILPHLKTLDPRFGSVFSNWGCQFTVDSQEASIFEAFYLKLQFKLNPHKSIPIYGLLQFSHYTNKYILSASSDQPSSKLTQIRESLTEAFAFLEMKFNTKDQQQWKWGTIHVTHYPHLPFSQSPMRRVFDRYHSSPGNGNTPLLCKMMKLTDENFNCQHHSTTRMVLTFARGESKWMGDTGSSGYPFSSYYDDQELLHKEGKYLDFDSNPNEGGSNDEL